MAALTSRGAHRSKSPPAALREPKGGGVSGAALASYARRLMPLPIVGKRQAHVCRRQRAYGVVVGCVGAAVGAGAVFVAAGGIPSSMLDAWFRVLRTT